MTPSELDNLPIYRKGQRAGHVESYFLKGNDPAAGKAFWLKFTFFAPLGQPEKAEGEVWAITFDMTNPQRHALAKAVFPISDTQFAPDRVGITMGPNRFGHGETSGALAGGAHTIAWSLRFTTDAKSFHHFPYPWLYKGKLPKSKAKTPHPNSRFNGWIDINGARWNLSDAPGMQGHNWGSEHTHRYIWAHSNLFEGAPNVWFEGFSGRVKIGPFTSPYFSMVHLNLGDRAIGPVRLGQYARVKAEMRYYRWEFDAEYGDDRLAGWVDAPKDDLLGLTYRNPNGPPTYCLNSKIASAQVTHFARDGAGWREVRKLVSQRGCALELGVKEADHGVRMAL